MIKLTIFGDPDRIIQPGQIHGTHHKPTPKSLPHHPLPHVQWPKPSCLMNKTFNSNLDKQQNPKPECEFAQLSGPPIGACPVDQIDCTSSSIQRNPQIPVWTTNTQELKYLQIQGFILYGSFHFSYPSRWIGKWLIERKGQPLADDKHPIMILKCLQPLLRFRYRTSSQ